METVKTVELRTAYTFDCENCGQENFVRAVVAELSNEERAELAAEHGVECVMGTMVRIPSHVTCCACKATFRTVDMNDE